jgi:very-short-patch-repair endonuclease
MVYLGKSVERDMYYGARGELFRLAFRLRKNQTPAEKILWKHLKKLRSEGYVFRRQHPVEFYIADFYCHKLKLIIEVDGEIHHLKDVNEHDDNRSGELNRFGIKIIRFKNDEILNNQEFVMKQIRKYITESASPALLGAGDGRG